MLNRVLSSLFNFETGDDQTMKVLKVFVGVAQVLFGISFIAYGYAVLKLVE